MIAELHGKISGSGSNLSDRLEDKLTGDVFGTLRYLPFQLGMAQILKAANISSLSDCIDQTKFSFWGDRIQFWPYHEEGEMDAFLELDNSVISIEVKYMSGLSSDDDVDNTTLSESAVHQESCNQLARESRMVKEWCPPNKKPFLIFIASGSDCASICRDVKSRNILASGVELGCVSWQEILHQLSLLQTNDPVHMLMLDDINRLLRRKGFERFQNFNAADTINIDPNECFFYKYDEAGFSFENSNHVNGGDYFEYR